MACRAQPETHGSLLLAAVRWAMQPTSRYEAPRHLSPASRAGNVGNRRHPAHRRPGCLGCWWLDGLPSTTRNSWVSTSGCSEVGDAVHDSLRSSPSSIACLQGWKRWEPASSRPPAPRVLGLLVARWFAEHNQKLMGLYFWLLFETYMRRLTLRGFQLLRPIANSTGAAGRWSLLVRASGLGQPGKTGEFDTSVSLDVPRHRFSVPGATGAE